MSKMTKDVVVLTKSSKYRRYCVAGIDAHTGEWIRLMSPDLLRHGALTDAHMTYVDGSACEPLDVVRVELVRKAPTPHQPENVLISEKKFVKLDTWTLQQVLRVHPPDTPVKVYYNTRPYLYSDEMEQVDCSLLLVQSPWLRINQITAVGKQKTKANFLYNREFYNRISVTDPNYYHVADLTQLRNVYLVVSLPDVPIGRDSFFKFIARIFE